MSVYTTAIAHLDRLVAAMKAGEPEHRIAQLRAAYDQTEAAAERHTAALERIGVFDVVDKWTGGAA